MRQTIKSSAKRWLNHSLEKVNLKVVSAHNNIVTGTSLEHDLPLLIETSSPLCIDVGANAGQTIEFLNETFDKPTIHAFEPSSDTFTILSSKHPQSKRLHLYQKGVGLDSGEKVFNNLPNSQLSSFLEPIEFPWLNENQQDEYNISAEQLVIIKLDDFITENAFKSIDLLKSDTQGYELNVLRGASESLQKGKIRHVLIEMNFFDMYANQVNHIELFRTLEEFGFYLIDLYEKVRNPKHNNSLSWCTALFGRRD